MPGRIWVVALATWILLLAGCDEGPERGSIPEGRLVFLGLLDDEVGWQLFTLDGGELRQFSRQPDIRELWVQQGTMVASEFRVGDHTNVIRVDLRSGRSRPLLRALTAAQPDIFLPARAGDRLIEVQRRLAQGDEYVISLIQPDGNDAGRNNARSEQLAASRDSLLASTWTCSDDAVYFVRLSGERAIVRMAVQDRELIDVTPDDLAGHDITSLSVSCDERVMAVLHRPPGSDESLITIYREGRRERVIDGDDVVDPFVTRGGDHVLYVDHYGAHTNAIKAVDLRTGEVTELVGRIGAFAAPILMEPD